MEHRRIEVLELFLAICISNGYAKAPKKIIGGTNADIRDFPYQVSIQQWEQHFCGGSILDATHILTAAHCVVDNDTFEVSEEIEVVTGTNDKFNRTADNVFPVSEVRYHYAYTSQPSNTNDIAVLKLAKPIPFNAYQRPIKLPSANIPDSIEVVASGWGVIQNEENGYESPQYLQKLVMKVVSTKKCSEDLAIPEINARQICAAGKGKSGTCLGDSGGPIVYDGQVVGVASFGIPCAYGFPDVFTRIRPYIIWIRGAMAH